MKIVQVKSAPRLLNNFKEAEAHPWVLSFVYDKDNARSFLPDFNTHLRALYKACIRANMPTDYSALIFKKESRKIDSCHKSSGVIMMNIPSCLKEQLHSDFDTYPKVFNLNSLDLLTTDTLIGWDFNLRDGSKHTISLPIEALQKLNTEDSNDDETGRFIDIIFICDEIVCFSGFWYTTDYNERIRLAKSINSLYHPPSNIQLKSGLKKAIAVGSPKPWINKIYQKSKSIFYTQLTCFEYKNQGKDKDSQKSKFI